MIFNQKIDRMRLWCIRTAQTYREQYASGGIAYVGYQLAEERHWDEFEDID